LYEDAAYESAYGRTDALYVKEYDVVYHGENRHPDTHRDVEIGCKKDIATVYLFSRETE
jgi:hypothetical protein